MPSIHYYDPYAYKPSSLRLEIEYATFKHTNSDLTPYRLTIESDLQHERPHKWVLYFTDLNTVRQLYLLLLITPKIMKDYLICRLDRLGDLQHHETKLNGLINKYKEVLIVPNPDGYEPQINGVWFTKQPFIPPISDEITLSYFQNKMIIDLENLKDVDLETTFCRCLLQNKINEVFRQLNEYIYFLRRVCEDFLVFLRFFGDLEKYSNVRKDKVTLYRLEKDQLQIVKQALRFTLKCYFQPFTGQQTNEIMFKVFLPTLKYSHGIFYFFCYLCEFFQW